jgi:hypothetical protein
VLPGDALVPPPIVAGRAGHHVLGIAAFDVLEEPRRRVTSEQTASFRR